MKLVEFRGANISLSLLENLFWSHVKLFFFFSSNLYLSMEFISFLQVSLIFFNNNNNSNNTSNRKKRKAFSFFFFKTQMIYIKQFLHNFCFLLLVFFMTYATGSFSRLETVVFYWKLCKNWFCKPADFPISLSSSPSFDNHPQQMFNIEISSSPIRVSFSPSLNCNRTRHTTWHCTIKYLSKMEKGKTIIGKK